LNVRKYSGTISETAILTLVVLSFNILTRSLVFKLIFTTNPKITRRAFKEATTWSEGQEISQGRVCTKEEEKGLAEQSDLKTQISFLNVHTVLWDSALAFNANGAFQGTGRTCVLWKTKRFGVG